MMDKPALNLDKIRAQLDSARGPLYWKSLEELAGTAEFRLSPKNEFADSAHRIGTIPPIAAIS